MKNSFVYVLMTGLLILCDGVISHNRPQIASDRTIKKNRIIHKRTHKIHKIKHKSTSFLGVPA